MSSSPTGIACGLRFTQDQQMRYAAYGPPIWIVIRNYTDAQEVNADAEELGFTVTVAASGAPSGTQALLIDPPPVVKNLSMFNLAQAAQVGLQVLSNGKVGGKKLTISHTWVLQQMALRNITDPRIVFEDDTTVGLLVGDVLMSITSVNSNDAFGEPLNWTIIGTTTEEG